MVVKKKYWILHMLKELGFTNKYSYGIIKEIIK